MSRSEISKAIMELATENIEDVYVVLVTSLSVDELKQLVELIERRRIQAIARL